MGTKAKAPRDPRPLGIETDDVAERLRRPGASLRSVARALGCSVRTVQHHARRAGLVRVSAYLPKDEAEALSRARPGDRVRVRVVPLSLPVAERLARAAEDRRSGRVAVPGPPYDEVTRAGVEWMDGGGDG